jgi:diaminopimelate decarboxylase
MNVSFFKTGKAIMTHTPFANVVQEHLGKNILDFINKIEEPEFDPFYLYDSEIIRTNCRTLKAIPWDNKSIHFASMANVNPEFLKIVKDEGVNIFVNSLGHMEHAMAAGFRAEEIIFTASALTEKTMRLLEKEGVQCNVDSPAQLAQWQRLFPYKSIGIRCNVGERVNPFSNHAGYFIGKESRLGFTLDEIEGIAEKEIIKGLHLYAGTDIFDIDYFIHCYEVLAEIALSFPNLEYLNFGGGFGVSENGDQTFNWPDYYERVKHLMEEVSGKMGRNIRLILEPGRIIGGEAGFFVCHVTDVKIRDDRRLVGVNASTVQFSRPLLYPDMANHPVRVIRNGKFLEAHKPVVTTVYGCSTYSRDIFSRKKWLPEIKVGDILLFGIAGSYSASSFSTFLGFPKPKEYFV